MTPCPRCGVEICGERCRCEGPPSDKRHTRERCLTAQVATLRGLLSEARMALTTHGTGTFIVQTIRRIDAALARKDGGT